MRAPQLCDLASDWLAERFPSSLIVREFSAGNWGSARIDIAAICEDEIVGIEIKGDGDSHARLDLQGRIYSLVATRMALLPAPSLERSTHDRCPDRWAYLRLADGAIKFPAYPWGDELPWQRLDTAPARLLECLIGKELKAMAVAFGLHEKGMTRIGQWADALAENVALGNLRRGVCSALRSRDWLKYDRSINVHRPHRYRWADGSPVELQLRAA